MPRLTPIERERSIGMLQANVTPLIIAQQFRCHVRTIERLGKRFWQTGTTSDLHGQGRPHVTTRHQDQHVQMSHLSNRFLPATMTARTTPGTHNPRISTQTVRNRLRENVVRPRRPYVGPNLTLRHRRNQAQWAAVHQRWRLQQWRDILFSDESRFCLERRDGRALVYRRPNERYSDACVMERDRFGGGSVMVWGGITYRNCTRLIPVARTLTAVKYRDNILAAEVLPFINANRQVTFQQDNAPSHIAHVTRNFLNTNNVNVLPWSSKSPDLNPIEHLWDALDRKIRNLPVVPQTLPALQQALIHEWNNIPQQDIRKLISSMRRRCTAVV